MLTKNFLHQGPNEIAYYNNNPLHPEFLTVFEKTSYYTTTWKKRLKVPRHHKGNTPWLGEARYTFPPVWRPSCRSM